MNLKNLAMWGIIVFLTIGLYNMFKNPQSNVRGGNQIIFSEFLTSVDNGEILKVDIQEGRPIIGRLELQQYLNNLPYLYEFQHNFLHELHLRHCFQLQAP